MEMALCTMQRRGDLVRMGRQHLQGGVLTIGQEKTGTVIEVPILPELQVELDQLPSGQMTFLITDQGKAFVAAGFGNLFRDWATGPACPRATTRTACARRVPPAALGPAGLITRSRLGAAGSHSPKFRGTPAP